VRSIALLSPLLSDEAKKTPYWKAWVAHVRVLEMSLRSSFSLADVTLLDQCITEHHQLFLKVRVTQCVPPRVTHSRATRHSPSQRATTEQTRHTLATAITVGRSL
jgi:hypothetical protein